MTQPLPNATPEAALAPGAAVPGAGPAPQPAMPSDVQAFESVLGNLEAAAPQGPSAVTDLLTQVQGGISAAFDMQSMPTLAPNASFIEATQYTMALNARLAQGQQAMTLVQGVAQKAEKAAEALLPKTG